MLTCIIYDIQETNNRNHLIKLLQHYGLKRIQKSTFTGYLDIKKREKIEKELDKYIETEKDSISIIAICNNCEKQLKTYGNIELPEKTMKKHVVLIWK